MGEYAAFEGDLDATGMRFAVAVARFNHDITSALLEGAQRMLDKHGADQVDVVWVPGAFELPMVAQRLAATYDAVICLGAVIRGDTPHFEYVAGECARGLTRVALDTSKPVIFGVLTVDNRAQANERIGGAEGHKGEEAATTAIEMVSLLRTLP
ncbi:MAG: 6,7-dimethyl-8-ribityllumazine synthase [Actinomycetota bacterium]|nr:6,7-dimethyl-8-ribityllumazine synthase [Actinomycetota bacterium]